MPERAMTVLERLRRKATVYLLSVDDEKIAAFSEGAAHLVTYIIVRVRLKRLGAPNWQGYAAASTMMALARIALELQKMNKRAAKGTTPVGADEVPYPPPSTAD